MTTACNTDKTKLNRTQEKNGLVLISEPSDANAVVAVYIQLRSGSRFDPAGRRGLHALLQRTLRKGTASHSEEQLDEALDGLGASLGAGADRDFCSVSLQCTQRHFADALPLLLEVLQAPSFPAAAIEKEKVQMRSDLKEREDQFLSRAFDLFQENYYGNYPYHYPGGTDADIAAMRADDVRALYHAIYRPENLIVSVVGPVNAKAIEAAFAKLAFAPGSAAKAAALPVFAKPSQEFVKHIKRETVANWLVMGFDAPSDLEADEIPMQVMNGIMGGSMNSRLFTEVRDKKGMAYQIGSTYARRQGPSFWALYFGTKGSNLKAATEASLAEITRIKNTVPAAEELQNTKAYLKGSFLTGQEHNMDRASMYANFEAEGRGIDYGDRYLKEIDAVKAEDVQRVAQKYLNVRVEAAIVPK